jgi:hypothetical protein
MFTCKSVISVLSPLLCATSIVAAYASSNSSAPDQTSQAVSVPATAALPPGYSTFAHVPATADKLVLLSEDAKLRIVQDKNAADISVASNCPMHWNVAGPVIRQAGFAKVRSGVSMKSDALGSRAIVNGKVYPLPSGSMRGPLNMNPAGGVTLAGQRVEPLAGTDMPGIADGEDDILVVVPASYAGDLTVGAAGHSQVALPAWQGGSVKVTLLDSTQLSAGSLSGLHNAAIDMHGDGKADIEKLSADTFVASITGNGSINVDQGKAKMSNATVQGNGQIKMKGQFENLKQAVVGHGTIQIN